MILSLNSERNRLIYVVSSHAIFFRKNMVFVYKRFRITVLGTTNFEKNFPVWQTYTFGYDSQINFFTPDFFSMYCFFVIFDFLSLSCICLEYNFIIRYTQICESTEWVVGGTHLMKNFIIACFRKYFQNAWPIFSWKFHIHTFQQIRRCYFISMLCQRDNF